MHVAPVPIEVTEGLNVAASAECTLFAWSEVAQDYVPLLIFIVRDHEATQCTIRDRTVSLKWKVGIVWPCPCFTFLDWDSMQDWRSA